jgi:cell division protein ZapA (FtsZ GTPase activity inhibitor)
MPSIGWFVNVIMNEVLTHIALAGRTYPLKLNEQDAKIAQQAAIKVNEKLKAFEQQYGVRDVQDLFAMVSLQLASDIIVTEKQKVDTEKEVDLIVNDILAKFEARND